MKASAAPSHTQSTHHPHTLFGFSPAHLPTPSCALHSSTPSPFPSLLPLRPTSSHPHPPPPPPPLPTLSLAYLAWQRHLLSHLHSLTPPLHLTLTSTPHPPDEKCDEEGVRLTLHLPLPLLLSPPYPPLLPPSLTLTVDIGRTFTHPPCPSHIAFHFYVQCYTTPPTSPLPHSLHPSTFPFAHLIRYRIAQLLDDYPPFFPLRPLTVCPSTREFPGCLTDVPTPPQGQQPLLDALAPELPMNPILHLICEVQRVVSAVGAVCAVCGADVDGRPSVQSGVQWTCDSSVCVRALCLCPTLSSQVVAAAVSALHPCVVDLLILALLAALPALQNQWGWGGPQCWPFHETLDPAQFDRLPGVLELRTWGVEEWERVRDGVRAALCWLVMSYRLHLHCVSLPPILPRCTSAFLISLHPSASPSALSHLHSLIVSLSLHSQPRPPLAVQTAPFTLPHFLPPLLPPPPPPAFYLPVSLSTCHTLLARGPILTPSLQNDLRTSSMPLLITPSFHDAVTAACSAGGGRGEGCGRGWGGRAGWGDRWGGGCGAKWQRSELCRGPVVAVLLCERLSMAQAEREVRGEAVEAGDGREVDSVLVMRAIFVVPVAGASMMEGAGGRDCEERGRGGWRRRGERGEGWDEGVREGAMYDDDTEEAEEDESEAEKEEEAKDEEKEGKEEEEEGDSSTSSEESGAEKRDKQRSGLADFSDVD